MDAHQNRRISMLKEVAAEVSYLVGPQSGFTAGTVIDVLGV